MKELENETPLMKQYYAIKAKYPDTLVLFRVGDFYETFKEDAHTASAVLGITLTKRANGKASEVALAGFPYHSMDTYVPKLVKAGYKVAICDQLEDPKLTKTIVKRGVTEIITPGVVTGENILNTKSNNFLASIFIQKEIFGIAFLDISTGEFFMAQGPAHAADKLIQSLAPSEIIYPKSAQKEVLEFLGNRFVCSKMEDWVYTLEHAQETLLKLFEVNSLKGFGVENEDVGIIAAGAAIQYLKDTEHHQLAHIAKISKISESNFVWLDRFTIRNLELVSSPHPQAKTLLDILDETVSPMGARLLRRWVVMPLIDLKNIQERQDAVEFLIQKTEVNAALTGFLKQVGDLERLISKVAIERANPRELVQLKRGLQAIQPIQELLFEYKNSSLIRLAEKLILLPNLIEKLEKVLKEDSVALISKGNFIQNNVDETLDELRAIKDSGKEYISGIQQSEILKTGISSLKIGFNNVFGYYLEVTNTHKDKVPNNWIRKQTLSNCERYITEELKEYEQKVLGAEDKIQLLEERILNELILFVKDFIHPIQQNAQLLAQLDCLHAFSVVSHANHYTKPVLNNSHEISISNGRHPVIEKQLNVSEKYIANDVFLSAETQQILMITGPNMSGKSALLRQTALIVLLAQMGCFVPADSAEIGLVDKVFTRVGASDNLSAGESTFMVEMNETASIMNNISTRSLILLDEIGRGTSTYDGISIAWALAEFLHNYPVAKPLTLFATHYHELNELAEKYDRIKNFHVSTKEINNKVIFLRKLVAGGSEHSFGIHVAKMAGMPRIIVDRANEILLELEQKTLQTDLKMAAKNIAPKNMQLSFFDMTDPSLKKIAEILEKTEVNALTPIEALMRLNELKNCLQ